MNYKSHNKHIMRQKVIFQNTNHKTYTKTHSSRLFKNLSKLFISGLILLLVYIFFLIFTGLLTYKYVLNFFIAFISIALTVHSAFTIFWMVYIWDNPDRIEASKAPKSFIDPKNSFSILIPARHEESVIKSTIQAVSNLNYPQELIEIFIICRFDDTETILQAQKVVDALGKNNIRILVFHDSPVNKPHGLNYGLTYATKDFVVIFDAEDEPNRNILQIANTVMIKRKADVLQSAIQLMNFKSQWFSVLNVLEYFFWFKSTMQFFARSGLIPLGGNTVFFKRKLLNKIKGWDENCLTEDADVGIKLSIAGANIQVVYDETIATQEETPPDMSTFIKQRTRWNQGFMQILYKGEWLRLKKITQKILALYILVWPEMQALLFLYIPLSLLMIVKIKLYVLIAIISVFPLYLLVIQLIIYNVGLYQFCRDYRLHYPLTSFIRIILFFYPFQILLGLSAFRAVLRIILGKKSWEKTMHVNAHRKLGLENA